MQYIRSISGSVSNTWNSINPATLSGAIDVIVVEQEDGTLACSPFHVRFGKFSLLRPSEKKVEFAVNGEKKPFPMKLGEGGEAFFVFETSENVPHSLQTSPVVSPVTSPTSEPLDPSAPQLAEPDELDLAIGDGTDVLRSTPPKAITIPGLERRAQSDAGNGTPRPGSPIARPKSGDWSGARTAAPTLERAQSEFVLPASKLSDSLDDLTSPIPPSPEDETATFSHPSRSSTMPLTGNPDARARIINLSKKLFISNISNQITDNGNLALDMKGYTVDDRTGSADALRVEAVVRKILEEELDGNSKIGDLIGVDEKGNLTVYGSEEAKEAAERRNVATLPSHISDDAVITSDAMSDPGYHSDDDTNRTVKSTIAMIDHHRRDSDSAVGLSSPPKTPEGPVGTSGDPNKNYAKTLRLTSDQLKELNLKPGENKISFTANRVSLQSSIYMWHYDVPIVISDIDGTITKSDVMGHVMNAVGRDWTHLGVAKLYTDIVTNGYNIFYLTSRSVGQADTTRTYLHGIAQDGYKLPRGPVILSPDRTWDALRREIYLRKPEVFKMACLRDIMNLFNKKPTPFYAGFGNRQTDAYSYRSVGIPSTRIFTINSNAEVSLDLLSLGKYKTGYAPMQEIVDHFFPPTGLLVTSGGEDYTDFNYWRDRPLDIDEFSDSESDDDVGDDDDDDDDRRGGSVRSEDDRINEDLVEDLQNSLYSRPSMDDSTGDLSDSMIMGSLNGDSILERDDLEVEVETEEDTDADDEDEDVGEEDETVEAVTPTVLGKVEDETHTNLKDLSHVLNSPAMSIKAAVTGSSLRSGRDDVSID